MDRTIEVKFRCNWPLLICCLCSIMSFSQNNDYSLKIEVYSRTTNRPLENANIAISPCLCGGITNADGIFSIELVSSTYRVTVSHIGYTDSEQILEVDKNSSIKVFLDEQEEQLSEVIVRAKKITDNLTTPQMGALKLNTIEMKKIPAAIGEFDILRGMTLLAGVNNAGEVSNGISVRGGSLDQNLILYDYAPVFNPTHLFGLFSVFTPDAVSSVDLYRANIPSRYGGRTSSVMDIKVKNPYVNKTKLSGGVGLVSSRIALETPLIENKLMLGVSARAGFTGFLLPIFSERLKNTKANFYDSTIKLLYIPTVKDQFSLTGFWTKDFYQLDLITQIENINSETNQYDFRTLNGTLNWTHTFDNDANLRTLLISSNYLPKTIFPERDNDNEIEYNSKIGYTSLISEYAKDENEKMNYYLGVQANQYQISPGNLDPGSGNSILSVSLPKETSYEFSAYTNVNWNLLKNVTLSGGLRFNHYVFVGPYEEDTFDENTGNLLGTTIFNKGDGVKTYNSLEPRFGSNIKIGKSTSIKTSYARLNQYFQNVYNSTTPLPTSRYKTSDPFIKPQISNAFGIGLYQNFSKNTIEFGVEGYYRKSENNLIYKPGANFFLAENLELDVLQVEGKSYGIEFSVKKALGKVNGWLNYTWSRSLQRSQNEKLGDRINNNQWFATDFDKPHVFNGTVNFEGDKYNTWSFNFTAQSGRPYTVANGVFPLNEIEVPLFLERNNARLRTYHRLDFSWKVKYSKKENRRWSGDWTFTIYNLYGRRNPLNLYYTQRNGAENGEIFLDSPLGSFELSVLNSPLLAITYNFVFQ